MFARANPLVEDTAAPAILEARAWLAAYDGGFGPAMDLSQAAPPYAPSETLLDRLAAAAASPETARYGRVRGETVLREAYADHLGAIHGGTIDPEGVTITAGCNQAFFVMALTLLQRGDRVLLPTPWYFNHQMTLRMLGVEVVPLPGDPAAEYVPDVAAAEALIDSGVRAIVLVTPNNPTGTQYPPEVIEAFYSLCRRRGIWLILDETYRDFRSDLDLAPHGLATCDWPDGLVSLYSFSKAYAVPGHRLGAITAPLRLGPEILKAQDCVQICAGRAIQMAMGWGLSNLSAWKAERRADIQRAALALRAALADTGWEIDGMGAYFAYLRHPCPGQGATEVAERLARECGLLLIPGTSFGPGQERHLRLSFPSLTARSAAEVRRRLLAAEAVAERGNAPLTLLTA